MEMTIFGFCTAEEWLFIWLGIIVITILIEIISVGLTSIWLTGGALAAMIVCLLGGHWGLQIAVFFVVTFVLIYFTRPWALKYLENRKTATNFEETIGKTVRVIERVDNKNGTGKVDYNGMEWTARAQDSDEFFEVDEEAVVCEVQGVKMILKKAVEE